MKRRDFLKYSALVGAGLMVNAPLLAGDKKKAKVIVIGAGMSGITAAKELVAAGYEVVILEGRDRIGGRMYSSDAIGTTLDFGASWIHGPNGNPITKLVENYGIKTKETEFDKIRLWSLNRKEYSPEEIAEIFKETEWVYKQAGKYSNRQDNDIDMESCINAIVQREGIKGEDKIILDWRTTTLEMNAGCDYGKMSTWYGSDKGFGGNDRLFPGGYKQLIDKMSAKLKIQTGQKVKEIQYDSKGVKITTDKGTFEGDMCICTIPLGVLQKGDVKFNPPLPADKQRVLDSKLGMGLLNKIAFKFDEVFWPTDSHFISQIDKTKGHFPVFMNWAYYTGKPYLLGFLVGDYARGMEKKSDAEIMEIGNKIFKSMFKNAKPIKAVARSQWSLDPFCYGAYSYTKVGGKNDGGKILAEPIKTLCFAGEHTSTDYPATVHGAHMTGLREAKRIISK